MDDAIPQYDELKLRIDRAGSRGGKRVYTVEAIGVDRSRGTASFTRPFSDRDLDYFVISVGLPRRAVRAYRSSHMEAAKEFGAKLHTALFRDAVRDVYATARHQATSNSRGLRVTLCLTDTPELMQIPWEYLWDGGFVSQSIYTPVVRSMDHQDVRPPRKVKLPLRILGIVSRPNGVEKLDVETEKEKLERSLAPLTARGVVEVVWLERATLGHLHRRIAMPDDIHVLHFIGHGGFDPRSNSGVLLFEDERGERRDVSGDELCAIIQDEWSLQLAVLNSCEGGRSSHVDPFSGVASSLVRCGVPAVVGMQFEITDEAAVAFSEQLYTALGDGYPIDAAVAQTRKAIFAAERDTEFGTPVLFLRASEARLFEIDRTASVQPGPGQVPPAPLSATAETATTYAQLVADTETASARTPVLPPPAGGRATAGRKQSPAPTSAAAPGEVPVVSKRPRELDTKGKGVGSSQTDKPTTGKLVPPRRKNRQSRAAAPFVLTWTAHRIESQGDDMHLEVHLTREKHLIVYKSGFWESVELDGTRIGRGFWMDQEFTFEMSDGGAVRTAVFVIKPSIPPTVQLIVDNILLYAT